MPNLKELQKNKIVEEFKNRGIENRLAVPHLVKIIVSSGIGKNRDNGKFVDIVTKNLAAITGQKPVVRHAKKAISGFKVRENDPVGLMVTLRGQRMYDFLDRLANIALPRLRDFRGLDHKSFDGRGNLTLGIREHLIFPEIAHEGEIIHGLEVTIATTAKSAEDGQKLLELLGLPFKKENK